MNFQIKRKHKYIAWDGIRLTTSGIMFNTSTGEIDIPIGSRMKLMEYTGIDDIHGKEIYEGFILKHHGVVMWNEVEHCWSCVDLNWNDKKEWHHIDYLTSPFEIIGNVYSNPELLK